MNNQKDSNTIIMLSYGGGSAPSERHPTPKAHIAYCRWSHWCKEKGYNFYRGTWQATDIERGVNVNPHFFDGDKWVPVGREVTPGVYYDKIAGRYTEKLYFQKKQLAQQVSVVNSPEASLFVGHKLNQYFAFQKFMPKSWFFRNNEELQLWATKYKEERVVLKPLAASGGDGVFIGSLKSALEEPDLRFPLVVQEYIEPYHGVPGIYEFERPADLRLVYVKNELIYAVTRIAAPGSELTNLRKGATAMPVPVSKIPAETLDIVKKVCAQIKVFSPVLYCIDFLYDRNRKPYLLEVNTRPGGDVLETIDETGSMKRLFFEKFMTALGLEV